MGIFDYLKSIGYKDPDLSPEEIQVFEQQCSDNLLPEYFEQFHFQSFSIAEHESMGGHAPNFSLAISPQGFVSYHGNRNVQRTGKYQWQLPAARLLELKRILARNNFFNFNGLPIHVDCCHEFTITVVDKQGTKKIIEERVVQNYLRRVRKRLEQEIRTCLLLDEWLFGEVYIFRLKEKNAQHIVSAASPADAVKILNEWVYEKLYLYRTLDDFDIQKMGIAQPYIYNEETDSSSRFYALLENGIIPQKVVSSDNSFPQPTQATPQVFYSSARGHNYCK